MRDCERRQKITGERHFNSPYLDKKVILYRVTKRQRETIRYIDSEKGFWEIRKRRGRYLCSKKEDTRR